MFLILSLLFHGIASMLLLLGCPVDALAYLDPGSGSYFFQILIATILGGAYATKLYLKKLLEFISNMFSKKNK